MTNSREESPDWLRSFKAPGHSPLTLSSASESSQRDSSSGEDANDHEKPPLCKTSRLPKEDKKQDIIPSDSEAQSPTKKGSKTKSLKKQQKLQDHTARKRKKTNDYNRREGNESKVILAKEETSKKHIEPHAPISTIWSLSSDSESCPASSPKEEYDLLQKSQFPERGKHNDAVLVDTTKKILKSRMISKENDGDMEIAEEEMSEKHVEPNACSSRLPLVLTEKVNRTKALVECEGKSMDMSGDMGAVGRVVISDTASGDHEMLLDLKGTIYRTTIVPSRTFCVVSFGQSEAKIEAIMNDFVQLKPQSNIFEAETMVEGTLDGFSFDSEDEADRMPKHTNYQNAETEGGEDQVNGKTKGKAEKSSAAVKRKGKTVGGKPQLKTARKKSLVAKRAKTKK